MDEVGPRRQLAGTPSNAQAWCDLGQARKARREDVGSLIAYDRARAVRPFDPAIIGIRRVAVSNLVAPWHFRMLHDRVRNDAYARAIRSAIKPHHHVLEIGTGAGLLAMLCARAGARQVTTCEMIP